MKLYKTGFLKLFVNLRINKKMTNNIILAYHFYSHYFIIFIIIVFL